MRLIVISVCSWIYMYAISSGEMLFNGNCLTCHKVEIANSAPTIQEVQAHYKKRFSSKEAYVAYMVRWIEKPTTQEALMPEAIKSYGLMPELGYDRATLEEIAMFLYDHTF